MKDAAAKQSKGRIYSYQGDKKSMELTKGTEFGRMNHFFPKEPSAK